MFANPQTMSRFAGARRVSFFMAAFLFASVTSNLLAGTIVGAWYFTRGGPSPATGVLALLSDNRFMYMEDGDSIVDPSGEDGIEKGTYAWDPATGAISINTVINTNGRWGFCNAPSGFSSPFCGPPAGTTATASDTTITFAIPAEGTFTIPKLYDPTSSIVGAWYFDSGPAATDLTVYAFLPDGTFMSGIDPPAGGFIEFGTYAWDPVTGALTVTINTSNAPPGFSSNPESFTSARILGGGLVLSSPDTTLRLTNSEVPEPATFGLLAAGLAAMLMRRRRSPE